MHEGSRIGSASYQRTSGILSSKWAEQRPPRRKLAHRVKNMAGKRDSRKHWLPPSHLGVIFHQTIKIHNMPLHIMQ
jgi:hypothetical protein